ncbi:hypothetical protein [Streptomyces sp. NPDC059479]|uniref:hypothetical protein n=1 Tax=Streptomyces sp. NPDC059479 TaxID=3346848 RepID=UPI003673788F
MTIEDNPWLVDAVWRAADLTQAYLAQDCARVAAGLTNLDTDRLSPEWWRTWRHWTASTPSRSAPWSCSWTHSAAPPPWNSSTKRPRGTSGWATPGPYTIT